MTSIAIDCRFAQFQAGLGRYTRELVPRLLSRTDGFSYTVIVRPEAEGWAVNLPGRPTVRFCSAAHYSLREQLEVPRILRTSRADLLFTPHFNVPCFCPVPFVATIHDLILHRYPNQASLPKRIAYRVLMRRTVMHARRLISVSSFVATELRAAYGDGILPRLSVIG
ncbi:MAG: glycosyltransferase, partial [Candidatus Peribacteraceae bacterium]|nr:glycosyltransferase [Candidatus Peribacteraceae bacterium]